MTDTVSVVIPVRDGEAWLAEAIDSVLAQAGPPHEVLVVDDGSTDGTAGVIHRYGSRVRALHQARAGAAAARNLGIREATGSILAFLDADDLWTAGKTVRQLAALGDDRSESRERRMVFGHARDFAGAGGPERPGPSRQAICAGTLLVRRSDLLEVGLFDPSLEVGEFLAWFARAVDLGLTAVTLDEVLLLRRVHDRNTGVLHRDRYAPAYLRILHHALERRRGRGV